jgi:pyruvate,orthophosphate dikinase
VLSAVPFRLPPEDAEAWKAKGEAVILCRQETSPEDVGGMHAAEGILTSRGGMTSHAAVVARGWGKPCCCGCEELIVDAFAKTLKAPVSGWVAVCVAVGLHCVGIEVCLV